MITLFDTHDGTLATAASLTPADAARHAWAFLPTDALLLSDEALLAVAKVRPTTFRAPPPPPPVMPRIGKRRARLIRRKPPIIH